MAFTNTQIGAIIASCVAAVFITAITILLFTNTLNRLTFLRRRRPQNTRHTNCPHNQPLYQPIQLRMIRNREELDVEAKRPSPCSTPRSISGEFETYGNLTIPPDRRPVPTAFDIVNRVLMVTGLPAGTTVNSEAPRREVGSVPRGSTTPSEQVGVVMVEVDADGVSMECHDGGIVEQKWEARDSCTEGTGRKSRGFGTGKSMAALYHAV